MYIYPQVKSKTRQSIFFLKNHESGTREIKQTEGRKHSKPPSQSYTIQTVPERNTSLILLLPGLPCGRGYLFTAHSRGRLSRPHLPRLGRRRLSPPAERSSVPTRLA